MPRLNITKSVRSLVDSPSLSTYSLQQGRNTTCLKLQPSQVIYIGVCHFPALDMRTGRSRVVGCVVKDFVRCKIKPLHSVFLMSSFGKAMAKRITCEVTDNLFIVNQ